MPQGSNFKAPKSNPKKPKITKASKKGSRVTKKIPKKTQAAAEKKKFQKAFDNTVLTKVEADLRIKVGRSSVLAAKKAAAAAPKSKRGKK